MSSQVLWNQVQICELTWAFQSIVNFFGFVFPLCLKLGLQITRLFLLLVTDNNCDMLLWHKDAVHTLVCFSFGEILYWSCTWMNIFFGQLAKPLKWILKVVLIPLVHQFERVHWIIDVLNADTSSNLLATVCPNCTDVCVWFLFCHCTCWVF